MPLLTDQIRTEIAQHFPRYPTRQAVLLPALHLVHEHLGHVPRQAVIEIGELLGLAPAEVQDALSFYGFFKQEAPVGRYRLWVCRSLSCALRGGETLLAYLQRRLGIAPGQTTADGKITLEYAECLGACDHSPALLVNDVLHRSMTEEKMERLLAQLKPAIDTDP